MEKTLIQEYIDMTDSEKRKCWNRSWHALEEYQNRKKLPYGATSEKQIAVKKELRRAKNWKPGY